MYIFLVGDQQMILSLAIRSRDGSVKLLTGSRISVERHQVTYTPFSADNRARPMSISLHEGDTLACRQRHNTNSNVRIARGQIRSGSKDMFGAFATRDLPKNYYICAWTGTRVEDNDSNTYTTPVNFFDMQAYGISAENEDGSSVYICPPLDEDGKPLFSVQNDVPFIEPGSSEQGLAIFLNEPIAHSVFSGLHRAQIVALWIVRA